jgi:hypothetical protein
MRAHKTKSISPGATQIAGPCLDSSRSGVPDLRRESNTAEIDDLSVTTLISFCETLDRWDREAKGYAKSL